MKNQISPDHFRTWISQNKTIILFFIMVAAFILVILWMTNRALVRIENGSLGVMVSGLTRLKDFKPNK